MKVYRYAGLALALLAGPSGCEDGVGPCIEESITRDWDYGTAGRENTQDNIRIWRGDQERAGWNCSLEETLENGERWACNRCGQES